MDERTALEIISLLAKAWASNTEGDVSHAFQVIAKTADEAEQRVDFVDFVWEGQNVYMKNPINMEHLRDFLNGVK